jgi:hypothetical protein
VCKIRKALDLIEKQNPHLYRTLKTKTISGKGRLLFPMMVSQKQITFRRDLLKRPVKKIAAILTHEGWHYVLEHHYRFYLILSEFMIHVQKKTHMEPDEIFAAGLALWRRATDLEVNSIMRDNQDLPDRICRPGVGEYVDHRYGGSAEQYFDALVHHWLKRARPIPPKGNRPAKGRRAVRTPNAVDKIG